MGDISGAFGIAFETAFDPFNFVLIIIAVLFGMLLGAIPGLGGIVVLALLIPVTYGLNPIVAFMILAAAKGGTNFAGSMTSILINTPGSTANAATLMDGYPMTRQGRAGEAIGASAAASAFGALFGVMILTLSLPFLMEVVLLFTPPEVFWLGLWGVTMISMVVRGSVIAGLISGVIGLLLATHGANLITATSRFDYGFTFMQDGIPIVALVIGLFAIAEMIKLVSEGGTIEKADAGREVTRGKWTGVKQVAVHKWLFVRSATIGAIIGVVPGVGTSAATFIAYFQAVQTSPEPDSYGQGNVRGVIAPEAANDSKDGTGYLPTLSLGIPGSASMAVLLGAFVLHGITPGPSLLTNHLEIMTVIIVAAVISNFATSIIGLTLAEYFSKITRIDVNILAPVILVVAFTGTYAVSGNIYHPFIALAFGVLGFYMMKVEMSRIPLILGFVLGPVVERNYFRSLEVSDFGHFVFVRSPLTIILIGLIVVSLFTPWIQKYFAERRETT